MSVILRIIFFALTAITAAAKLQVVTSQALLADFVSVVGGDQVAAASVLPANADPHTFEPRPADLRILARADLVVINGLGLEPWAESFLSHAGYHGKMVRAGEGSPRLLPSNDDDRNLRYDPHAWHNSRNAEHYVAVIRDALIAADPPHAENFRTAAEKYFSRLRAFDVEAHARVAQLPTPRRWLVTSHDSFRYWADEYGFQLIPIAGPQPDREPGARELGQIVNLVKSARVRAIFVDPNHGAKLADIIADDAHVEKIFTLYTDDLGPPGSPADTYLGMMRSNLDTIVRALQ